ncbi:MAG: Uma2 family endonuclease [Spirosomaceae bacterium]|jgi:Uma2 family endonuclease|nr:Uma2 family endonuclease [Spirosomataceae bacterium]
MLAAISQEEYLTIERGSLEKHEYYQGEITMMAGAPRNHNRVKDNFSVEVGIFLKHKRCQHFTSDMRVHIPKDEFYTYPDLVIVCGKIEVLDNQEDTLLNPSVIVEVLSKGTADYDRAEKFERYRSIESFQEYILVDSRRIKVEVWRKNEQGLWTLVQETSNLEDKIEIRTIEHSILIEDIYAQTVGLLHLS